LNHHDLLSFAENSGYLDIVHDIQYKWFKDIACVDPLTRNLLLKSALGKEKGELILRIRAHILRAGICIKMAKIMRDVFSKLIMQEGRCAELEEILRIDGAVKKHLIDEGFAEAGHTYDFEAIRVTVRPIDMSTHLHHVRDTKYQGQLQSSSLSRCGLSLAHLRCTFFLQPKVCTSHCSSVCEGCPVEQPRWAGCSTASSVLRAFEHSGCLT
jgi:hypothetical protein